MKINTRKFGRSGIGIIAAIIIIICLVVIVGYMIGCITKLARKLNDPPKKDGSLHYLSLSEGEQIVYTSEPALWTTNMVTGEGKEFTQVIGDAIRSGVTNQIIVQRWFPDGRPEEYLYTTNINYFGDLEIYDSNPPADMGFYHIYIVVP